ncbi:TonB-linked SusC/RagA family outer membrane protein [Pedobacter africanus]|uniref:SusC/RagA family TonB-linked outer membrane protein n=1 Tax=Pedobacter africanus TaxID=151894 RepID=UPI00339514CC
MKKNHARFPIVHGEEKKHRSAKERHRIKFRAVLMRINLITFFTLITFLQVTGRVKAQQITLNVKNSPLEEVFKTIERQTSYVFFFPSRVVKDKKTVNIQVKNMDFKAVMEKVLEGHGLVYSVSENSVIIKEAAPAVKAGGHQADITIKGRVTDSNGKPLTGVTIKLKGAEIGTMSDHEGRFAIDVPDDNAVLLVSSIGYITIQVPIKNNYTPNIRLVDATAQLKEVTVLPINTGYESIKPERFVGSATVIDSTILARTVSRDLLSRLDGTTNGLIFLKTASSSVPRLNLRGIATLGSNTDLNGQPPTNPLIVLDDFPFSGDVNSINPNDIESISILKDAASASVWGAKAGNGVIVITTKKGKYNSGFAVNVRSSIQIEAKPDMEYFPWMNSSDFIDVEQFLFDKGFQDIYLQRPNILTVSPAVEIMDKKRRGVITEAEATKQLNVLRGYDVRNDYNKYVLRNSINNQNYINISGGSNNLNYNIGLGTDYNKTSIKGPGAKARYSLNSSLNIKPIKFLEIQTGISYINENSVFDGLTSTIVNPIGRRSKLYPYARLADNDGKHLPIPYKYTMSFIDAEANPNLLDWHYRPLDEKDLVDNNQDISTLRLNIGMAVNIVSWLKADIKYQYSNQKLTLSQLYNEQTYFARDLVNSYTSKGDFKRNIPLGGILDKGFGDLQSHNVRGQLSINKNWNGKHTYSAIVVADVIGTELSSSTNRLYGYNNENLTYSTTIDYSTLFPLYFGGAAQIPARLESIGRSDRLVSILANSSYTFNNRYTIYGSVRRDGSNLFGVKTNNKWKPLWSIGTKYTISNEDFFRISQIDNLAVRASYGYTGNVNNTVPAVALLTYSSSLNTDQLPFAFISNPPNPDLRWESVRTTNVGIDFSLFKSRVSGSLDVYNRRSRDVISSVPADPTLGISGGNVFKNVANLQNKGVDVGVHLKLVNIGLKWTASINYSHVKTKVEKFFGTYVVTPRTGGIREGDIYGAIYAYKWGGLDPQNGDPQGYLGKLISKDYAKIFVDSLNNQAYIGSPNPMHYGNILNSLSYKNFELSFNISFRAAYYFRKPALSYSSLYNGWDGHPDYLNRWRAPGDEAKTNVPSMPFPANANRDEFYAFSEVNYERGDHIRLQDIRLGYTFIRNTYTRFPVKSINVFLVAGNLNWMLWRASKTNLDPDFPLSEIPPRRTISFGTSIGF